MHKRLKRRNNNVINTEGNISSIQVIPKRAGRKSSYDPVYCDLIIEKMQNNGISLSEFAKEIGVHPNTLLNWRNTIPEFNEACEMALEYARAWWEKLGRELVVEDRDPESPTYNGKKKINTMLYIAIMRNRGWWTEKVENKLKMSLDTEEMDRNEKPESHKEISEEERARKIISILDRAGYIQQRAAITAEAKAE